MPSTNNIEIETTSFPISFLTIIVSFGEEVDESQMNDFHAFDHFNGMKLMKGKSRRKMLHFHATKNGRESIKFNN